jgi:hypothetical protein
MKTPLRTCIAAAALALTACFAEVEDRSVVIERRCTGAGAECTFQGVPAEVLDVAPIGLASGASEFRIDLGQGDLLQPEREVGPVRLRGTLRVRAVTVQAQEGVPLDGVEHLQLAQLPSERCEPDCRPVVVARYDRPPGGATDPSRIVLEGNPEVNLLAFGSPLVLRLEARGRPPSVEWRADLTLDAHLSARADFP